jgi:hypothetical protein
LGRPQFEREDRPEEVRATLVAIPPLADAQ